MEPVRRSASRERLGFGASRWTPASLILTVLLAACSSACSPASQSAFDAWGGGGWPFPQELSVADVALVVYKSRRTIEFYRDGVVAAEFPVVLGRRPTGNKLYEGDLRTPEGLYHVAFKSPHRRWRYFIGIDYPNDQDRRAYESAREDDELPTFDGHVPAIGSSVGIHGNDHPRAQAGGVDWTEGCIALRNRDIATLYAAVPIGAPVLLLR
jgi:hypothetical protein